MCGPQGHCEIQGESLEEKLTLLNTMVLMMSVLLEYFHFSNCQDEIFLNYILVLVIRLVIPFVLFSFLLPIHVCIKNCTSTTSFQLAHGKNLEGCASTPKCLFM